MANTPQNIIWIDGCDSHVGTNRPELPQDGEGPPRKIRLKTFGLSTTTVNNTDFAAFVASTGYRSDAHRIGWSFVFRGLVEQANGPSPHGLPWWAAVKGATWDHPLGPGSDWSGLDEHPVVHVSHGDALAYATWVGGRELGAATSGPTATFASPCSTCCCKRCGQKDHEQHIDF